MKSIYLIGYGKWGKRVFNTLNQIKQISKIQIKKNRLDKKPIHFKNIDWVFVTTNTKQHYKIVKKFLNKKINVFCEKPLTTNYKKSKELFNLAKKNKCKLYVSDIENIKNINLKFNKINSIVRSKFSNNKKDILNRLAYHDFTYIYKKFRNKRIQSIKVTSKINGLLSFILKIDNKSFFYHYDLNSRKKIHTFNKISLRVNRNFLKKMIRNILLNKVNYKINKEIALFSNKMIDRIKKIY